MIAAWFSKAATPLIVIAAMLLAAAFLGWLALKTVDGMVDDARAGAIAERDAHWKSEISAANVKVAQAEADRANATLRIQAEATARVRAAESKLIELEKDNAALPDGAACGLDHGRVRLLAR